MFPSQKCLEPPRVSPIGIYLRQLDFAAASTSSGREFV